MDQEHPDDARPQTVPGGGRSRSRWRAFRRYSLITLGGFMLLLLGGVIAAGIYVEKIIPTAPPVDKLLDGRNAQPSVMLSANGTLLTTFDRGQQEWVGLDQISPHVVQALIATEDRRFYEHHGVDVSRTIAAALHTAGGDAQGGSTITQQLARNFFPERVGRAPTIERKLREIITAIKIERAYTKDEILEIYLNSVPFLYNVIGIEMAARTYFGKPAAELDLLESATLVGMLKGTSYYNPILNPKRALSRRNVVLSQMVKYEMLSPRDYDDLRKQPLRTHWTRRVEPPGIAPHFVAYARRQLLAWADAHHFDLYTDGLVIHSTLDDKLQEAATEAVARESAVLQDIADVEWARETDSVVSHTPSAYTALRKKVEPFSYFWHERAGLLDTFVRETPEFRKAVADGKTEQQALTQLKADPDFMKALRAAKTRLEAGFLAMDPESGAIKAWVGSRDFEREQFDHVAQAARQPGSTFKPMVYGAALEHGLEPGQTYPDGEVEIPTPDGGVWSPTDMSGYSGRMISLREGLIMSKNTITAQVMQDVGVKHVIDLARAVGIRQSRLDPVPSLSLGTSPVSLLEMVSAYSTIARVGRYRAPVYFSTITDRDGRVLDEAHAPLRRVMSERTSLELIDMLRGVVREGTGVDVRNRFDLSADIAGKTGTTQNNTDGWFILMHPRLVAGAWVGFNDQRVTMRSDYWGQGGHNASLLVGDFFRDAFKAKLIDVKAKFPRPRPREPLMVRASTREPGQEDLAAASPLPPGYGAIRRESDGATIVIAPDGTHPVDRADADDDLGHLIDRLKSNELAASPSTAASGTSGDPGITGFGAGP